MENSTLTLENTGLHRFIGLFQTNSDVLNASMISKITSGIFCGFHALKKISGTTPAHPNPNQPQETQPAKCRLRLPFEAGKKEMREQNFLIQPLHCVLRHCLSTIFMTRIALVCRHCTLRTTPKDPLPQMSGVVLWGNGHKNGCRWDNCMVFRMCFFLRCLSICNVVCMIINSIYTYVNWSLNETVACLFWAHQTRFLVNIIMFSP